MVKTFDILLDLEKELYSPSSLLFSISRNDFNSIQLNFVITQDGTPIDLLNKTVELAVKKPSGLTVYQACEITNAQQGKAKLDLNQQAYIEYGIYMAEVYIRDTNQLAVTSPFWYQSRTPIFNDTTEEAIQSSNDWSALQEALFAYDLRPQITEGFPTITPEYIGQMAFDRLNKITYIASDLTSASWRTFGAIEGEGGGGSNDTIFGDNPLNFTPARIGQMFIDEINEDIYIAIGATAEDWEQINNEDFVKQAITWSEILEKPTTFAPEAHTHTKAQIIDFAHNHAIGEITGLQLVLDSKADDSDLTTKANSADVYTKLETYNKNEVDNIVTGLTEGGGTIVEDNLNSNSANSALSANQGRILNETKADINHSHDYAPNSHSHIIAEIEGLQTELDSKADINHSHTWGEITDKPTTFAPEAHVHVKADITDFAHNHDWAEIDNKPTTFAPSAHNHDWAEIDNKPTTFAPSAHNHTKAQITDFAHTHLWAEIIDKPTTFTPEVHNHAIGEITGLQASLDAKADDSDLAGFASATYVDTADNYIINTLMDSLKLWSGTQAEYDAIGAKDATTLYFVTG